MPQTDIKRLAKKIGAGIQLTDREQSDWVDWHSRMRHMSEQLQAGNMQFRNFSADHGFFTTLPHEAAAFYTINDTTVPDSEDTTIIFDATKSGGSWQHGLIKDLSTFDRISVVGVPGESVFLFCGHLSFNANATGRRSVAIKTGSGAFVSIAALPSIGAGGNTTVPFIYMREATQADDHFKVQAYQDSGGDLGVSGQLAVVRLR